MRAALPALALLLLTGTADGAKGWGQLIIVGRRSPNPQVYRAKVPSDAAPRSLGVAAGTECHDGVTSDQPPVRLRIEEGQVRLRLLQQPRRALGQVNRILVLTEDGKRYWCSTNHHADKEQVLFPSDWAPGDYEVRIVHRGADGAPPGARPPAEVVHLFVEDTSRGETFLPGIRVERVESSPARTRIVHGALQPKLRPNAIDRCDRYFFPDQPDLFLDVTRAISDLRLEMLPSSPRAQLRLRGPLPEGDRWPASPGVCQDNNMGFPVTEGRYAIYVGAAKAEARGEYAIAITGDKAQRDPLARSPLAVPPRLPAVERALTRLYYDLRREDVEARTPAAEELRQRLFREAPRALWVTPSLDLDQETGGAVGSAEGTIAMQYLRKGEPLLIYRAEKEFDRWDMSVLTADGLVAKVNGRLLVSLDPPAAVFPREPRGSAIDLGAALALAPPEDRKDVERYEKAAAKLESCRQAQLKRAPSAPAAEQERRVRRACSPGPDEIARQGEVLRKELAARRQKRRAALLERLRADLSRPDPPPPDGSVPADWNAP